MERHSLAENLLFFQHALQWVSWLIFIIINIINVIIIHVRRNLLGSVESVKCYIKTRTEKINKSGDLVLSRSPRPSAVTARPSWNRTGLLLRTAGNIFPENPNCTTVRIIYYPSFRIEWAKEKLQYSQVIQGSILCTVLEGSGPDWAHYWDSFQAEALMKVEPLSALDIVIRR